MHLCFARYVNANLLKVHKLTSISVLVNTNRDAPSNRLGFVTFTQLGRLVVIFAGFKAKQLDNNFWPLVYSGSIPEGTTN